MAVIAVTGHIDLTGPSVPLVRDALHSLLAGYPAAELTGVSCLAEGADALFAAAVLATGGRLVAVIPAMDYRGTKVGPHYADEFDRLCRAAAEVVAMP
jgi:hypothetical protein